MISKFIVKYPYVVIIVVTLATVLLGYLMKDLEIETDITKSLPDDHPSVVFYEEVQELFPTGNVVVVGLESQELFTPDTIELVDDLTHDLSEIPGVSSALGPTTVDVMRGTEWGMEILPILDQIPRTADEVEAYRAELTGNRMYGSLLVAPDESAMAIVLTLESVADDNLIHAEVTSAIQSHAREDITYHVSGQSAMFVEVGILMNRDLVTLTPIVLVVLLFVLYVSFRSIRGVVLPMLTVVTSVVWTFGIMAIANVPLNIMTTVLPVLLVAIGSAYGIHMVSRYYGDARGGMDKTQAVEESVTHTGVAVLMAGLTTIAGFLALRSSPLDVIKEFGFLTATGIVCALVFSLTFIPAILVVLPLPGVLRRTAAPDVRGADSSAPTRSRFNLGRSLAALGRLVNVHRWVIVIIAVVIIGVSVVGIFRIRVETDMLQLFGEDTALRTDAEFINSNFAGTTTMQVVISGDGQDSVTSPEILQEISDLQQYLTGFPIVGNTQSIADMVKEMNQVLNDGSEDYYSVPESRELVSQYLLLLSFSGGDEALERFLDFNYESANVSAFLRTSTMSELRDLTRDADAYLEEHFRSAGLRADLTGGMAILTTLSDLLLTSQIRSLLISLVLVLIITSVLFGSLVMGMLAIIPLTVTVALNFGLMGILGIPVDIATVMIASIAIGIGIDYAIHYLTRYRSELRQGAGVADAIVTTTTTTGTAIVYNASAVGIGFLVLVFSSITSLGMVGIVIALTMLVASVGSLTLLPAILSLMDGTRLLASFHPGVRQRWTRRRSVLEEDGSSETRNTQEV
jgi:predicted RND superfamily exporter protein